MLARRKDFMPFKLTNTKEIRSFRAISALKNCRSLAKSYELYFYNIVAFLMGNKTNTRRIKIGKIALGICEAKKKRFVFE